jgi:carboxyl-terminal processing protease
MKVSRYLFIVIIFCVISGKGLNGQFSEYSLKFGEVFDKISRYYVDTINEDRFVEQVINKTLHDLDPHSSYLSRDEVKSMQEPLDGNFEGIGVSFNILEDTIFIVNPIPGGPSEKLGIRAGDRIIHIDGANVAGIGITNTDVMRKLKGKKGTRVTVSILRRGMDNLLEFVITRDRIPYFSIDASYMIDDRTGYIKLSRFSLTSMDEFQSSIAGLKRQGLRNLILDLDGNGGGYLPVAVNLADQFISGNRMIVYTEGMQNPRRNYYSSDAGEFQDGMLVVMIDESSASASEIVAGALQDWDRAVIVGRKSFGKGLVQQPFQLSDGSMIRLTVAKYFTPTGRLIQKPYLEGFDAYSREVINRYNNGQLIHADSITFPDSLKFRTLELKRIVYGGGGIMPDYFVSLDTSYNTSYYRELVSKGILNQFILNYEDKYRNQLKTEYPDFTKFEKNFQISEDIIHQLISYAENEGLKLNQDDFEKSADIIKILIKSYLARDLWTSSEFYRVFNPIDPIYQKAIEVIRNPDMYTRKLQAYHGD